MWHVIAKKSLRVPQHFFSQRLAGFGVRSPLRYILRLGMFSDTHSCRKDTIFRCMRRNCGGTKKVATDGHLHDQPLSRPCRVNVRTTKCCCWSTRGEYLQQFAPITRFSPMSAIRTGCVITQKVAVLVIRSALVATDGNYEALLAAVDWIYPSEQFDRTDEMKTTEGVAEMFRRLFAQADPFGVPGQIRQHAIDSFFMHPPADASHVAGRALGGDCAAFAGRTEVDIDVQPTLNGLETPRQRFPSRTAVLVLL